MSRSDVDGGGSWWPTSSRPLPPKFTKGVLGKSIEFVQWTSGGAILQWPAGCQFAVATVVFTGLRQTLWYEGRDSVERRTMVAARRMRGGAGRRWRLRRRGSRRGLGHDSRLLAGRSPVVVHSVAGDQQPTGRRRRRDSDSGRSVTATRFPLTAYVEFSNC